MFSMSWPPIPRQGRPVAGPGQKPPQRPVVLLGQNLRGRHDGDLCAILHGYNGRLSGNDCLPGSDIPL